MKSEVLLRTFLAPLLLAVLLILRVQSGFTAFDIFIAVVFFASVIFAALLNDRKFVQDVEIRKDRLVITYLNQFAQQRTAEYELAGISDLRMKKRWRIEVFPPMLKFKYQGDWQIFEILSSKMQEEIRHKLELYFIAPGITSR